MNRRIIALAVIFVLSLPISGHAVGLSLNNAPTKL